MKKVYSIKLEKSGEHYLVHVPDFDVSTQGEDLPDALEMARDIIGMMGMDYFDDGKNYPNPTPIEDVKCEKNEITTLIDIDFDEYRKKHDMRMIRKNITIPAYLDALAQSSKLNVSKITQEALKRKLKVE